MSLNTAKATVTMNNLTAKFDNRVQAADVFYPEVSTIVPSVRKQEDYAMLGNSPAVREWLGDRVFEQLRGSEYFLKNRKWESSMEVAKDDIDDDVLSLYPPMIEDLADEATHHPDELLFETLLAGESEVGFDGQNFYDVDHQWGDSGVQSNDLTFTAGDPNNPTVAEFADAYEQARQAMLNFRRDNGKTYVRPTVKALTGLVLIVPIAMQLTANKALFQDITVTGESNIILDQPRIITSGFLTDPTKFYLFKIDTPLKPFIFQARSPLSRATKGIDDLETQLIKFMTQARYSIGYLAWWNTVLTTFTA